MESLDTLGSCGASQDELAPFLEAAEERVIEEQKEVDALWLGNAVTDLIALSASFRSASHPVDALRVLDRQERHLSQFGELEIDSRLELKAEQIRIYLDQEKPAQAEELWWNLVDSAGSFESYLALEWDDLYSLLTEAWIAAVHERGAFFGESA